MMKPLKIQINYQHSWQRAIQVEEHLSYPFETLMMSSLG